MDEMFQRIINSRAIIKQQQRDEPDLTTAQKRDILQELFDTNKRKFLEKYSNYLQIEDIPLFKVDDDEGFIGFYLKKVEETCRSGKTIKNRRYEAMRRLIENGEYFNDESMKTREPLLYEQMVGKYENDQSQQSPGFTNSSNDYANRGNFLTNFFMTHLDNLNHMERLVQLKGDEFAQEEESDEEEDDDDGDNDDVDEDKEAKMTNETDEAERACMRDEFLTIMHRKFLNGEDSQFDYNDVDFNDDYDNIEIESRDKEEKYFDDQDDEIKTKVQISGDYDY